MPYRVLSRYHRPNTSVDWHNGKIFDEAVTQQTIELMFTEFHGKKTRTVTETDPLTLEVEFIWESQATYEDWASRPIIQQQQALIDQYNASSGIIADPKEKSEV